ncbi:GNAT family N-acetyltransferase [Cytophagales bacterium LB-30]|uniref:GNAT family N-acetyltransferase n=1 Tax=Shiella aurantiaca TaxID=3058365 RepID=A0ABT8F5Y3_9BACT|nr:GNAT family N-acetyltransferase [Shiella aurantiaca]MDN4165871.1 GNAT family N-acetyltransferase [Shiella aurantiaca]
MQESAITIRTLAKTEEMPYPLLLLADPDRAAIDAYLSDSSIFVAEKAGETIGVYVLFMHSRQRAEIKNIAVDLPYQGFGIGKLLLLHAIEEAKNRGAKLLEIATGNTSTGPLHLYQKMGFTISQVLPGYFTKNYPEPIIENGQLCTDQIILTKILS